MWGNEEVITESEGFYTDDNYADFVGCRHDLFGVLACIYSRKLMPKVLPNFVIYVIM